jgi:hypothetical protein
MLKANLVAVAVDLVSLGSGDRMPFSLYGAYLKLEAGYYSRSLLCLSQSI